MGARPMKAVIWNDNKRRRDAIKLSYRVRTSSPRFSIRQTRNFIAENRFKGAYKYVMTHPIYRCKQRRETLVISPWGKLIVAKLTIKSVYVCLQNKFNSCNSCTFSKLLCASRKHDALILSVYELVLNEFLSP